jgi:hypothetical protein
MYELLLLRLVSSETSRNEQANFCGRINGYRLLPRWRENFSWP